MFAPAPDDISETHGRWIEREPGIFERADWDEDERRLVLSVRGRGAETSLSLAWVSVTEWRAILAEEGFVVEGLYGWFDRRPWAGPRGLDLGLPARLEVAENPKSRNFLVVPLPGEIAPGRGCPTDRCSKIEVAPVFPNVGGLH